MRSGILASVCLGAVRVSAVVQDVETRSAIGDWLQHLTFTLPYISLPGPVIDIKGGTCTGLRIGNIETLAYGTPETPEIEYRWTGVRLQCRLQTNDHEDGTVDFGMNDSILVHRVSVKPYQTPDPRIPLPMGPLTITSCHGSVHLEYLEFGGKSMLSGLLDELHNNIRRVINQEAPTVACKMLKGTVAEQLTEVLADQAGKLVPLLDAKPPSHFPSSLVELADWSVYPPVQVVRHMIAERPVAVKYLIALASPLEIPQFSSPVTQKIATSVGSILFSSLINFVHVQGLETMTSGSLKLNGTGSRINVGADFERVGVTVGMTVTLDFLDGPTKAAWPLHENLNFTLDISSLSLTVDILAMVSKLALDDLYVDQIQQPRCIAGCAKQATSPWNDSLELWDLSSAMTPALHIGFKPGTLEAHLANSIDTTVAAALRGYIPAVKALIEGAVQVQRWQLNEAMWQSIESLPPCGPTAVYLGPGAVITSLLFCGGFVILALGLVRAFLIPPRIKRVTSQHETREAGLFQPGVLCEHPVVPSAVVACFPAVGMSAICLLIYSHLCLATSINFVFKSGEHVLIIGPALAFSVVICAINALQARAYLIAACILLLSIVWPYIKLILLLVAWQAPAELLSYQRRERLLVFLDEYGKWSLIDTWLGILALASYKLGWYSRGGEASFLVDPVPEMPFFMFVFASILGLVLGHIASGYHRRAADWDSGHDQHNLVEHTVRRPLGAFFPPAALRGVVVGLAVTVILIVVGANVTTFQMVESGALATLMLDEQAKTTSYSLISLGQTMTAGKSGDIGLRMVQLIFFIFSLFIPVALQSSLLVLCLAPLPYRSQVLLFDISRALDAWAAFDVFAAAVTVSHLEFGAFSAFLMHYNNLRQGCGLVREYMHTDCFHMECSLTAGYCILSLAAVFSYLVPKFTFKVCRTALDERAGMDSPQGRESSRLTGSFSEHSAMWEDDDSEDDASVLTYSAR